MAIDMMTSSSPQYTNLYDAKSDDLISLDMESTSGCTYDCSITPGGEYGHELLPLQVCCLVTN